MNTATRVYGKSYAVRRANSIRFSWKSMGVAALIVGVLISAFGVIYAKDLNRRLFIDDETLQQQQQQSDIEWSKLLLEEAAWSTQARVQQLAQHQLNMIIPSSRKIVFVSHERKISIKND